jgi:hypothetical protein
MLNSIQNIEDVKEFARLLVKEGSNFHPDDDFADYVNYTSGVPSYTEEEVKLRNDLMGQSFSVCEAAGEDIYSIMGDVFLLETGMSKFIPLSTAEPEL